MMGLLPLSLWRNERGAALIELAMVAPVLALGVVGIVDISNAYSRKLALEQGAQRAIEKIMQTTANDTVENTLAAEACTQVDGMDSSGNCLNTPIKTSDVTVSLKRVCMNASDYSYTKTTGGKSTPATYTTTSTVTASALFNADACSSTDKEADYLQLQISSSYTPMFPIHFANYDGSKYPISSTAGVRIR